MASTLRDLRIICLVKANPILYLGKRKGETKEVWAALSDYFKNVLGQSEMSPEYIAKRWKTLRDSYVKEDHRLKANPGTQIKFTYYNEMEFLANHIRHKHSSDPRDLSQPSVEAALQPEIDVHLPPEIAVDPPPEIAVDPPLEIVPLPPPDVAAIPPPDVLTTENGITNHQIVPQATTNESLEDAENLIIDTSENNTAPRLTSISGNRKPKVTSHVTFPPDLPRIKDKNLLGKKNVLERCSNIGLTTESTNDSPMSGQLDKPTCTVESNFFRNVSVKPKPTSAAEKVNKRKQESTPKVLEINQHAKIKKKQLDQQSDSLEEATQSFNNLMKLLFKYYEKKGLRISSDLPRKKKQTESRLIQKCPAENRIKIDPYQSLLLKKFRTVAPEKKNKVLMELLKEIRLTK